MKRIFLILMAAFLMGGMVMAQHARRGDKMPDPKTRVEHMTERMAKEYSLNDSQKKQLLEANLAFAEKMGDKRMHHRADMRKGKKGCKVVKKGDRKPQLTDEQRTQKKAEMEKRREEMKVNRTAYDAQLQKIMTKDQYAAYTKKVQERKDKKDLRKKA